MPNFKVVLPLRISAPLVFLFVLTSFCQSSYAQKEPEQRTYTAPIERHHWIPLGNSDSTSLEYDAESVVVVDSQHIRIRIRETPLKRSYYAIKVTKMWEQRSIQGYSDNQNLHPIFDYAGYDKYGFTILLEEVSTLGDSAVIISASDYDLNGNFLGRWDTGIGIQKPILATSAEGMFVDLFYKSPSH